MSSEQTLGGWDAFYLLAWLSDGSPVSILEALPAELARHQDHRQVQSRLVAEVERYAVAIRGAECDAVSMQPIEPLIDKAAQAAAGRLRELGLWQRDMMRVLDGLVREAHEDLVGGSLVRLDCRHDPHRLYVASTKRQGVHRVVGVTTVLPQNLGGDVPSREDVDDRLHSRSLGLDRASAPIVDGSIHPWLPFRVEVF